MKDIKNLWITALSICCAILAISTGWLLSERQIFILAAKNTIELESKKELLGLIKNSYLDGLPPEEDLAKGQLKGIVDSLNDPYSAYLTKSDNQHLEDGINAKYEGIGVKFVTKNKQIIVSRVLNNGPAKAAGIQKGDILEKINGTSIDNLRLDEIATKIRGPKDTEIKLEFLRENKSLSFAIKRSAVNSDLIYLDIDNNIATITIDSFGQNMDSKMNEIAKQIVETKSVNKLILDLRANTGGYLNEAIEVISYFTGPDTVVVREQSKTQSQSYKSKPKSLSLQSFETVVLVDKNTASASEILAGSLRDINSSKLIGQKTYGKGVVQNIFDLKNGDYVKLTISKWLTPNGQEINKQGLDPDIKVDNEDEIIKTAIDYLKSR